VLDVPYRRDAAASGRGRAFVAWTGYAAFVLGVGYALVSAYWAAGGTAGVDTLGGKLADLARKRDSTLIAIVWVTVVLKLIGATLSLALVRQWTHLLPRPLLLMAAWGAATVLTLYGGVEVVAELASEVGLIQGARAADRKAFLWHLLVWDPWFLVWGLLLGATTWAFTHPPRPLPSTC
jgi:hypothetical protein